MCMCPPCVQTQPATVSRGVCQPEPDSGEPADLFSEEASSTPSRSNGVNSDDDDLFAGQDTYFSHSVSVSALKPTVVLLLLCGQKTNMKRQTTYKLNMNDLCSTGGAKSEMGKITVVDT